MADDGNGQGAGRKRQAGVIGASGFLGRAVCRQLAADGWRVVGFSRSPGAAGGPVDEWRSVGEPVLDGLDAVVNLTGEPIDQRWTAEKRRAFVDSRVGVTRRLVGAIAALPAERRPAVLVNASAVGIYGDRGDTVLDEQAAAAGGFLPQLCADWEAAAGEAEALGVRVVRVRIGVVLGRGGGAFERMRQVFALGLGGRFGHGRQWLPWIHLEDLARIFAAAAGDPRWRGPLNGTAPAPERNADFTAKLAAALHRPAILPVPATAIKLALGGFGALLLESQRAVPVALVAGGFEFRFDTLEAALVDLLGNG